MAASLDGRTLVDRWHPANSFPDELYDQLHTRLGGDAWIIGRSSGQEFAEDVTYPPQTSERFAREPWIARRGLSAYAVVLDPRGRIAWGRPDIGGDPIVAVLCENVPESHLAGLRRDGVSYIFAGEQTLDLSLALEILNRDLGIKRLLLEGGGRTNGTFLRAGLINELSLVLCPAIDGGEGAPCVFEAGDAGAGAFPLSGIDLTSSEALAGGMLWLRYRLRLG
jgi:riboflavin biosynthesis pyrimidine reductase